MSQPRRILLTGAEEAKRLWDRKQAEDKPTQVLLGLYNDIPVPFTESGAEIQTHRTENTSGVDSPKYKHKLKVSQGRTRGCYQEMGNSTYPFLFGVEL